MPKKPLPKNLVIITHKGDQEVCIRIFDKDAADFLIPKFDEFSEDIVSLSEAASESRDMVEALLDDIDSKHVVDKRDAISKMLLKKVLDEIKGEAKKEGIEWHYHLNIHPKYDAEEVCEYFHDTWVEWQKEHGVDMEEFRGTWGDLLDE